MRLLVCGSRDWTDVGEFAFHLALIFGQESERFVIHGNCGDLNRKVRGRCVPTGADVIAGWCAAGVGARVEVYAVDHRLDGPWPAAGPRRNARMLRRPHGDASAGGMVMSHDPNCDTCGREYDRGGAHVCDPDDLVSMIRNEIREAISAQNSKLAQTLRREAEAIAYGSGRLAAIHRLADVIEEDK